MNWVIRCFGNVLYHSHDVKCILFKPLLSITFWFFGHRHIPIHYISTAAEEMLAYCNTVPEWLCSTRQEKVSFGTGTSKMLMYKVLDLR